MPKYHNYKIILGVIPNILNPSLLITYRALTTHRSHDNTPQYEIKPTHARCIRTNGSLENGLMYFTKLLDLK